MTVSRVAGGAKPPGLVHFIVVDSLLRAFRDDSSIARCRAALDQLRTNGRPRIAIGRFDCHEAYADFLADLAAAWPE